jgi:uracil-DNA glycosylase
VALGKIAFDAWLQLLKRRGSAPRPRPQFGHEVVVPFEQGVPTLLGSFHPSRQNTNTGRLTAPMLTSVFRTARRLAAAAP